MPLPRTDFRAAPVDPGSPVDNERRYRAEVERAFKSIDIALSRIDLALSSMPVWAGAWGGDGTRYRKGAMVKDGAWLMIAIRDTVDRPAPDAPDGPSPDWDIMLKGVI
jgi:hypothetical protein